MKLRTALGLILLLSSLVSAADGGPSADTEAAYTRAITERADRIVAALAISDADKAARVRGVITRQYRDLNAIHTERDAKVKAAREAGRLDKTGLNALVESARNEAKPKLEELHAAFLGRLNAELSPAQVDQVKDGMTYGVVPLTYGVYLRMYPELKEAEKTHLLALLVEAREIAMDGSTSDEKHAVFGKYKGRINNYLSKAGYDAKQGEQNLKKTAPRAPENQPQ